MFSFASAKTLAVCGWQTSEEEGEKSAQQSDNDRDKGNRKAILSPSFGE